MHIKQARHFFTPLPQPPQQSFALPGSPSSTPPSSSSGNT